MIVVGNRAARAIFVSHKVGRIGQNKIDTLVRYGLQYFFAITLGSLAGSTWFSLRYRAKGHALLVGRA